MTKITFLCLAASIVPLVAEDTRAKRIQWLREAKWGTMTHYLSDWLIRDTPSWQRGEKLPRHRVLKGPMTPAKWNRLVQEFDVDTFAKQLKSIGVGYHIMTVGQTSGYYLSPNKTYDKIIGRSSKSSWFPKRDLIKEMGDALHKQGIRFIVYIPIEEPLRGDKEASSILRPQGKKTATGYTISSEEAGRIFIRHWSQILEEYATRWGTSVDGWWFDGCWQGKMSYKDAPNWDTIISVLRKGNPDTLISFNHQYRNLRGLNPPQEDFFAGETNNPETLMAMSPLRDDGATSQMLTYLGYTWYFGNQPRFHAETASRITRNVTRYGGTITWDIAITPKGHLLKSYIPTLKAINAAARENLQQTWHQQTKGKFMPAGNLAYKKPAYMISNKQDRGHHSLFTHLLPPNAHKHVAAGGVDNNPTTMARASNEWAWSYAVDLIQPSQVATIHLSFAKDAYATDYEIATSMDGLHWKIIHTEKKGDGSSLRLNLQHPTKARWIKVKALKPHQENQTGTQMGITEIQVFGA